MSHASTTALCRAMKLQCELYPSRHVALCLDPYCGLGFALWCLSSVYSGHHTILIPPSEVETNPAVWLTAVSQYKVRDTFCSYGKKKLKWSDEYYFQYDDNACQHYICIFYFFLRCYGTLHKRSRRLGSSIETKRGEFGLCSNVCCGSRRATKDCPYSIIYETILWVELISQGCFNIIWVSC